MQPPYEPVTSPDGLPPQPPRKRHHWVRWTAAGVGGLVVLSVVAGVASGSGGDKHPGPVASSHAVAEQPAPSPTAVDPSPDGTFQGSCNYDLGDSPSTGTAVATGDIEADNTGNVGIVVKVKITWPQEGFSPLSMTKTVRVPQGQSRDVQFHMPLTGSQLDRLQNYQEGHGYADGCTYNGTMTDTFGIPVG